MKRRTKPSRRPREASTFPPKTRNERIEVRVLGDSKDRWKEAARRANRSLASWMTLACDHLAASSQLPQPKRRKRRRPIP